MTAPFLSLAASLILVPALFAAEAKLPTGEARVYKQVEGHELKLYIVRPEGWKATDTRPALVLYHGGGWVSGTPAQFNEHSAYFSSRGLVCVKVEYRFLEDRSVTPPIACIEDARSAMRWVRGHARELGIDPQRIAAGGGSAGGHLAAHVGLVESTDNPGDDLAIPARANALVLFNPVLDNGPGGWGTDRVGDRSPEFSPAHNVSPDDPPAILFLGSEDKLIPVATLQRFTDAMTKAGVRCELHVYPGQGHGFFNHNSRGAKYYRLTVREADRFLVSLGWLQGPPTLPPPAD